MIVLRDYQEEAIRLVIEAYERNPSGRELLVLPCAAGKTIIFSHIIDTLARVHGTLAIVMAHLDELLGQAADKFRMVKPDAVIGKVGSGIYEYGGEVTVAGVQTIARENHLRSLKALYGDGERLLIVVDEAHLSAAPSYQRVLAAFPKAFVLMVTATPYRLDGKPIIDKPPLLTKTIKEMIHEGYLCNIKAIAIRTDTDLNEIKTSMGDFNEKELDLAVNTPARNKRIVQAYLEHTPGKRAICFGVTVAHVEAIAYQFNDYDIPAAAISGKTPLSERQRLYSAFERGEILVLASVMVLSIGFDSPRAEVAIMARPTQSQALYVQQAGRVLRLAPNKKCAVLLDITDNSLKMRLQPQSFKRAIAPIHDDESMLELIEREEDEKAERDAVSKRKLIRKLNERRAKDVKFDPLALPEWEERENGLFVMVVGAEKHRIALCPCKGIDGLYTVQARLAPNFSAGQKWSSPQPLDGAMQFAEKRARMLLAEPAKKKLLDRNASWRDEPISEGLKSWLDWKRIPWTEEMTKGEACDLREAWEQENERKKAAKAERQAAKLERMEAQ
jgi:superfamily II DNA or RNA helicase